MRASTAQRGMSMVELMISITIGLILIAGVIQIFFSNLKSYRIAENISRMQEGGRIATELLARDIRMAGFSGCIATLDTPNIIVDLDRDGNPDEDYSALDQGGLVIHNPDAAPASLPSPVKLARGATDIIEIQRADEFGFTLTGQMTADNANIKIVGSDTTTLKKNDVLVISDCDSADIFAATTVSNSSGSSKVTVAHASNINIDNRLSKAYNTNARLYRYRRIYYYIKISHVSERPSLYRWDSVDGDQELITDVDDLQVLLSERNGTSISLISPESVTNYPNVVGVNIALLFRSSDDKLRTKKLELTYNGKDGSTYVDSDERLRAIFSKTVSIRNR